MKVRYKSIGGSKPVKTRIMGSPPVDESLLLPYMANAAVVIDTYLTVGNEYVALALTYCADFETQSYFPTIDLMDDNGALTSVPLYFCEVVEDTPSRLEAR